MRRRVLVTRAADQSRELVDALREAGLEPVLVPAIEVGPANGGELDAATEALIVFDWVVVTSANAARAIVAATNRAAVDVARPRWAAIAGATAEVLEDAGFEVAFRPTTADGATLASELPVAPGQRVLRLRGDLADETVATTLRQRGAEVVDVVAYRTREAPAESRPLLRAAFAAGPPAVAILTSGSTARGLLALGDAEALDVTSVPAVCSGRTTSSEAHRLGFDVLAVSPAPDASTLAATTAAALTLQPLEVR